MISLQYDLTTYRKFQEDLAAFLGAAVTEGILTLPPSAGEGTIRLLELPDGTEVLISRFRLNHPILLERRRDDMEFYTFCSEEITDVQDFSMSIGTDRFRTTDQLTAMYLTSFLFDVGYLLPGGSQVRSIRVLLTPEWMRRYWDLDQQQQVLQQYLEMKTAGVLYKKVDAETRQIMEEILGQPSRTGSPLLFYQSRILRLIEKFFHWMNESFSQQTRPHLDISREDIERMRRTESVLIADLAAPPTIRELARQAAISESKLKKLFRIVYGAPPYEYFQRHRMEKARVMLLTGKYTIKDVGYALGYANLSNFTMAFKKVYGHLPSDLLE